MISKRFIILLIAVVAAFTQVVAQDRPCANNQNPYVSVSKKAIDDYKQEFEIYAESIGTGATFEAAKADAYNKLLPELLAKAQNIGTVIVETQSYDDFVTERGLEEIIAKARIATSWELNEGVYCYTLRLVFISPELMK